MRAIYADLILALWLVWFGYWRISSANTKASVRREAPWSRAAHVALMLIAATLLLLPNRPNGGLLFGRLWPYSPWIDRISMALVLAGVSVSIWARVHLGRNWSGVVTVKQDHELVRSGPYAIVRHPIYSGLLLGLIGTALWRGEWRGLVAVAIACAALWYKLRLEERWMLETFGDAYRQYRRETHALIPLLL